MTMMLIYSFFSRIEKECIRDYDVNLLFYLQD